MNVVDQGEGEPVVMVHGNPTWSFFYRHLIRSLATSHRCIVPDHVGMGLSSRPAADQYSFRLEQRITDLQVCTEQLLDTSESFDLVVHDWGGAIGLGWALAHLSRIRRLVILNTAAFPIPESKQLPRTLGLVRNSRLGQWLTTRFNAFARGASRIAVRRPLSRDAQYGYLAPYATPADRLAISRFVEDIPLQPSDPGYAILQRIERQLKQLAGVPVLIGWGMRDFVFDEIILQRWVELLPHAKVLRFENAGHYVLEDAPELGDAITAHLR